MATLTFRDRFYTPQVARALNSPLGILLAGAGFAVGLAINLPIIAAVGLGAVAYGARVAAAIPKGNDFDGINPFALDDPWRTFVWQAKKSQRQFADSVKHTHDGPLRDRLREIADRIETGVSECWQVARSGHQLSQARMHIDIASITTQLSQLPTGAPLQANPALVETARALQSQLDAAKRMDEIIRSTEDRLRLLDARLGELVTRVIELSVRPQGFEALAAVGADVDSVVAEMESLRQALDETDAHSIGATGHGPLPRAEAPSPAADGGLAAATSDAAPAPPPPQALPPPSQQIPQMPQQQVGQPMPQPAPGQTQPPSPGRS